MNRWLAIFAFFLGGAYAESTSPQETAATDLHAAIRQGTGPDDIAVLLEAEADLDSRTSLGRTPLHWAALHHGNPAVIEVLLAAGAGLESRDAEGRTPLQLAVRNNTNPAVIEKILASGAAVDARDLGDRTALHLAIRQNAHPTVIDALSQDFGAADVADGAVGPASLIRMNMIDLLLSAGADLEARDSYGGTPLRWAVRGPGSPALMDALVRDGADSAVLETAVRTVLPAIIGVIDKLLAAGADPQARDADGRTPLHWAVRENSDPTVIERLLASDAALEARDAEGNTPLHWAARYNSRPEVIDALISSGSNLEASDLTACTPLHWAVIANVDTVVRVLLRAGADVEARSVGGLTPLHWIASDNDLDPPGHLLKSTPLENLELLLAAGADFHARTGPELLHSTPLHIAARFGDYPPLVNALLGVGAHLHARDSDGATPLHWAVMENKRSTVEILLAAGADPLVATDVGDTPLHWAARESENPAIIELLLEAGAKPDIINHVGFTAWDYAQDNAALNNSDVLLRLH